MSITTILQIDIQTWGDLVILRIIDDGVFICTCKITSSDKTKNPHVNLFTTVFKEKNIDCRGEIIDNRLMYHFLYWMKNIKKLKIS